MSIVGLDLAGVESRSLTNSPRHQLKNEELIVNTLLQMKANGRAESTIADANLLLTVLSRTADLTNPEEVKLAIANKKIQNGSKDNYAKAYTNLAKANEIQWKRPTYKIARKIPIIPTRENIMKVISASKKYATIFKILMETGLMPYELSQVEQKDIDLERGILNARGYKTHYSRTFKLTQETNAMLKLYFAKYTKFPLSEWMQEAWAKTRNKVAKKLQYPTIKTIRLYDLRHYYATMLYDKTRDILLVKQQLGHHQIETTMIYTQLIHFNEEEEYTCKTATDIKEATELLEHGFTYIQDIDGIRLYRKRK
jgi:integrase